MTFDEAMAEAGKKYLREVLERQGWNISSAARVSGRDRADFYRLMRKFGVQRPVSRAVTASRMTPEFRQFLGLS